MDGVLPRESQVGRVCLAALWGVRGVGLGLGLSGGCFWQGSLECDGENMLKMRFGFVGRELGPIGL